MDSNHYCILYEAPNYKNLDYFGFLLLNSLIGESDGNASFISSLGMSKFIDHTTYLAENALSVYGPRSSLLQNDSSYKCTYLPYNDTGNISLYLKTENQDAATVEALLRDYMSELAFTITDQDAERSKQIL